MKHYLQLGASVSLILLILLLCSWELFLAPFKNYSSWLVLKTIPLLLPLFNILKGKIYTYQWMSMFILLYFIEGAVRSYSDIGLSSRIALFEIFLTIVFFICATFYVRLSRQ
ncbi:MAG: DUF2069 domain-containing protein [Candidatus Methylopumilus sp.]|nr:DUF2069 domain-containing protein [Candidatus Methylopumilus sp.]